MGVPQVEQLATRRANERNTQDREQGTSLVFLITQNCIL
ncbi:hypothetical protein cce_0810 [Crocosphaera subtropica ATCC 51142]|uniref:Uncharacterized protein n=1 Tax=Crocosphaera subtropica (strain ATCC 51142 / BH68) TaxID=43989 RepID=B1WRW7_CROS5|nr:hypothetical protein cce_0810 [Crocosphaera subtropica ATCC 51142]